LKILVVGAGPVGATFALLAKREGLEVSLLEAREGSSREQRTLALSHGSRETLAIAGAWGETPEHTEIHRIHTSQKGGFGRTEITREDAGVPALGYVTTYADLQTALDEALQHAGISVERGAVVQAFTETATGCNVTYTLGGQTLTIEANVVVMADGGANLDKVPAIATREKDYGQRALLGHIDTDTPHGHRAYERFTAEGPAALLPKGGASSYSMVWVSQPERIAELEAMTDAAFCAAFQAHFGFRAGKFTHVSARRSYPLRLRTVSSPVAGHVAVIGNAAQALHPVAGQGFNLGLRDAAMLARLLGQLSVQDRTNVGAVLAQYAQTRARDVERSVGFTDFLVSAFAGDAALLLASRGVALAAVDLLPFARKALARRMLFGARR
jgi:2-octaprenyl-6-methoxyphenol hydroxylase